MRTIMAVCLACLVLSAAGCAKPEPTDPLADMPTGIRELVADDYPEWTITSYSRDSGVDTFHTVGLRHRARPLELAVKYTSWPNSHSFTTEQVLRTDAPLPDGKEALLDFFEDACADPELHIGVIAAGADDRVEVTWYRTSGWWIFVSTVPGTSYLQYDSDEDEWRVDEGYDPYDHTYKVK